MKTNLKSLLAATLAAAALTATAAAADAGRPTPPEGGALRPRPTSPLMSALDANHDGVIDAAEIANASVALKALDKDGDGKLTADEVRPARPEGGRGPREGKGPEGGRGPREGKGPEGARGPGGPKGRGGEGRPHRPAAAPAE